MENETMMYACCVLMIFGGIAYLIKTRSPRTLNGQLNELDNRLRSNQGRTKSRIQVGDIAAQSSAFAATHNFKKQLKQEHFDSEHMDETIERNYNVSASQQENTIRVNDAATRERMSVPDYNEKRKYEENKKADVWADRMMSQTRVEEQRQKQEIEEKAKIQEEIRKLKAAVVVRNADAIDMEFITGVLEHDLRKRDQLDSMPKSRANTELAEQYDVNIDFYKRAIKECGNRFVQSTDRASSRSMGTE
jgi:hypothetical protein